MTPVQKIKHMILLRAYAGDDKKQLPEITAANIDEIYDQEEDLWDVRSEVRGGEVETDIEHEWSRHYEAKSVAAKAPDGSWVGWTYWYGGGKHGEPEAIDWMSGAYDLTVTEKEVTITQQTFTKVAAAVQQ